MSRVRLKILSDGGYKLGQFQQCITEYLASEIKRVEGMRPKGEEGKGVTLMRLEPKSEIPWKLTDLSNLIKGYQLLWMFSPVNTRPQDDKIKSMEKTLHSVGISRVYELSVLRCYDEFKWLPQSQLSYRNVVSLCQVAWHASASRTARSSSFC